VHLANVRYNSGLSSYFEVIDAQLQLYPAEQFEVQYDLERKLALVNLYKALGGGWKLSDVDWMKTSTSTPQTVTKP
jgi:multidrug efflux system outer membrane protein